jgi:hypothetical protein
MREAWVLLSAGLLLLGSAPAEAKALAAWVEMTGGDAKASARVVTAADACPDLLADGQPLPMQLRAKKSPPSFPVLVCEATLDRAYVSISVDGKPLPLPPREPKRIVIIGDTGCRLDHNMMQDCMHPAGWPFREIARLAAAAKPDLVIHVGDYLYRDVCMAEACADWPSGPGWAAWDADFFQPAEPLLAAAPWIAVRGNHEDCDSHHVGGPGWTRFFHFDALRDPGKPECRDFTGFFLVSFGAIGFIVMDAAHADNKESARIPLLADQFRAFRDGIKSFPAQTWLLTHRPMNGAAWDWRSGEAVTDNWVEEKAIGHDLPAQVTMIVSGHQHAFEALSFDDKDRGRAPQLVVGTGGSALAPGSDAVPKVVNDDPVTASLVHHGFGYMVWNRSGADWSGAFYDEKGAAVLDCSLQERTLRCKHR